MKSTGYQVQEFTANQWENLGGEYSSWVDALYQLGKYAWVGSRYRIVKTTTTILSTGIYPQDFNLLDETLDI